MLGLGFASPNIISHEHNISHVGLYRVKQLYNVRQEWPNVRPKHVPSGHNVRQKKASLPDNILVSGNDPFQYMLADHFGLHILPSQIWQFHCHQKRLGEIKLSQTSCPAAIFLLFPGLL